MKYIVHKRFRGNTMSGRVNLPAKTECEGKYGFIIYNGNALLYDTAEDSYQHIAVNDDGMGMLRGKITQEIQKTLAKRDQNYQARWDKIHEDDLCQKYGRKDSEDYWLWGYDFFHASIEDLQYIARLIGANEVK